MNKIKKNSRLAGSKTSFPSAKKAVRVAFILTIYPGVLSPAFSLKSSKSLGNANAAMGALLSKSMDDNFKKQQEFMLMNARLQMERQILMQNQMRERQMAMQIAWSREFLNYFGSFFAVATVGLTAGAIKRKNPGMLAPIIPLSFIFAYQMDSAYGTLIYRMRGEAENIMETENDRLQLPQGTPTFESIEKARRAKSSLSAFLEK
uniref:Plasminogen receptor, C-terminal lysine transmembrane protein n=2 Tax=Oreochromis niloticus TaxID=8128 RepID=I3J751_ORENI